MKIVAIIQARMSSSRLPGKVLMDLSGKPVLEHIINRLRTCNHIHEMVVATSTENSDNPIEEFCIENNVNFYRGSLNDVLDRFYQASKKYDADGILRITADCPVVDPEIVDIIISSFLETQCDLCGLSGEFPDGLDCSVFSFKAIEKAWNEAKLASEREHVGPYIEKNPDIFKIVPVKIFDNLGHLRWTLDTQEDYLLLKEIYNKLYKEKKIFLTQDILDMLQKNPYLTSINDKIIRNEGYLKSLEND